MFHNKIKQGKDFLTLFFYYYLALNTPSIHREGSNYEVLPKDKWVLNRFFVYLYS